MSDVPLFFIVLVFSLGLVAFPVLAVTAPSLIPLTVAALLFATVLSVLVCAIIRSVC